MLASFLTFINSNHLFSVQDSLLVAVSGGKDSMVMLDLLQKGNFKISVAHCNFQLRGEASTADEQFVAAYCDKHQLPFFVNRFETETYAYQRGISIQMAARELRYAWFAELMQRFTFDYLLTAHHLNDNLETALLNLTKGTGITGLTGMAAKSNTLVRPLLFAERAEIDEYATITGIRWREDASNSSVKYQRNLLRHKVIPILKEINPRVEQAFLRTQQRLGAVEKVAQMAFEQFKETHLRPTSSGWELSLDSFIPDTIFYYLDELLKPYQFTFSQLTDLLNAFDKTESVSFENANFKLTKNRMSLLLSKKETQNTTNDFFYLDENETVFISEKNTLKLTFCANYPEKNALHDPNKAFLNKEKMSFPLSIRKWQEGDWFIPFGMKGKKLLSDFFIDKKFSMEQKQNQWLVVSGEDIVWVIGHRIDERYRITPQSDSIIMIELGFSE